MTGAYSYQIGYPPAPATVAGFTVAQSGENVIISWSNLDNVSGYNVYWGPQDQGFEGSTLLSQVTLGTEITTSKIPPGAWTFWINATDISGQTSSLTTSVNFTVQNFNTVLFQQTYVPTFSNKGNANMFDSSFLRYFNHWTGVLIPHGQFNCNTYVAQSAPSSSFIALDQVAGGNNSSGTFYFKTTFVTASGETLPSNEISINVSAGYLPTVFIPSADFPAAVHGWNVYGSTTSSAETLQNTTILGYSNPVTSNVPASAFQQEVDQIWQMPVTGLTSSGAAVPASNTTGWEVFNVFVPDVVSEAHFNPATDLDTLVTATKRVWVTAELVPGPGETGIQTYTPVGFGNQGGFINLFMTDSPPNGYFNPSSGFINFITTAEVSQRYVLAAINTFDTRYFIQGQVFYIRSFQITVDNPPGTVAMNSVSVSSSGTAVSFAAPYHTIPNVQVTPSSGSAIGGNAVSVTSTGAMINLFSSTGAVAGLANLAITGI